MEIPLANEAATEALGARIAGGLAPGDAVLLSGELGAGKSVLARAILRSLGVNEHVPSPTFTLAQAYETDRLMLHHFDLYRIERTRDLDELGIEDALDEGAILVEWPERAPGLFPAESLNITLETTSESARRAHITAPKRWQDILAPQRMILK